MSGFTVLATHSTHSSYSALVLVVSCFVCPVALYQQALRDTFMGLDKNGPSESSPLPPSHPKRQGNGLGRFASSSNALVTSSDALVTSGF